MSINYEHSVNLYTSLPANSSSLHTYVVHISIKQFHCKRRGFFCCRVICLVFSVFFFFYFCFFFLGCHIIYYYCNCDYAEAFFWLDMACLLWGMSHSHFPPAKNACFCVFPHLMQTQTIIHIMNENDIVALIVIVHWLTSAQQPNTVNIAKTHSSHCVCV